MHMISDFMHFDTIAFRQKIKSVWKIDGYNIRSVYALLFYTKLGQFSLYLKLDIA